MAHITNLPKGKQTFTNPTINGTAAVALAANSLRKLAIINNPSTTTTVYLGTSAVTTSAYAVALAPAANGLPGGAYLDADSNDAWWAVTSGASVSLNVTEIA